MFFTSHEQNASFILLPSDKNVAITCRIVLGYSSLGFCCYVRDLAFAVTSLGSHLLKKKPHVISCLDPWFTCQKMRLEPFCQSLLYNLPAWTVLITFSVIWCIKPTDTEHVSSPIQPVTSLVLPYIAFLLNTHSGVEVTTVSRIIPRFRNLMM